MMYDQKNVLVNRKYTIKNFWQLKIYLIVKATWQKIRIKMKIIEIDKATATYQILVDDK